jgi:hypothetical protein
MISQKLDDDSSGVTTVCFLASEYFKRNQELDDDSSAVTTVCFLASAYFKRKTGDRLISIPQKNTKHRQYSL